MSSFSSLTVRPSGCERIKLRTVSMARSCSGNLRLYDTIPPHGLPLLYLEGGTLGCGAFSRQKSSIQDRQSIRQQRMQPGKADTNNKCINHNSSKQHSIRILLDNGKNF